MQQLSLLMLLHNCLLAKCREEFRRRIEKANKILFKMITRIVKIVYVVVEN